METLGLGAPGHSETLGLGTLGRLALEQSGVGHSRETGVGHRRLRGRSAVGTRETLGWTLQGDSGPGTPGDNLGLSTSGRLWADTPRIL